MKPLLPLALAALALAACSGTKNSADGGANTGAPDASVALPLDQVNATITIVHSADDAQATVTAQLVTGAGARVVMSGGQYVAVGPAGTTTPTALSGPDGSGAYSATLPAADSYDLKVYEPTRGKVTTNVRAPAHFAITSPGSAGDASLSGFSLQWSSPEASATSTVTLSEQGATQGFSKDLAGDPGSYTFTSADLQNFFQGASLQAKVTKHTQPVAVQGFAAGTAEVDRSAGQALTPRP